MGEKETLNNIFKRLLNTKIDNFIYSYKNLSVTEEDFILNLPKNVEVNYNLKLASVNLRRDLKNDLNSVIQELKDIILGVDNARN